MRPHKWSCSKRWPRSYSCNLVLIKPSSNMPQDLLWCFGSSTAANPKEPNSSTLSLICWMQQFLASGLLLMPLNWTVHLFFLGKDIERGKALQIAGWVFEAAAGCLSTGSEQQQVLGEPSPRSSAALSAGLVLSPAAPRAQVQHWVNPSIISWSLPFLFLAAMG